MRRKKLDIEKNCKKNLLYVKIKKIEYTELDPSVLLSFL